MNNSVHPVITLAIIAVVLILVGFGFHKAVAPPQYGPDTHGGQPTGAHMPPAAYFHNTGGPPGSHTNTGSHP